MSRHALSELRHAMRYHHPLVGNPGQAPGPPGASPPPRGRAAAAAARAPPCWRATGRARSSRSRGPLHSPPKHDQNFPQFQPRNGSTLFQTSSAGCGWGARRRRPASASPGSCRGHNVTTLQSGSSLFLPPRGVVTFKKSSQSLCTFWPVTHWHPHPMGGRGTPEDVNPNERGG